MPLFAPVVVRHGSLLVHINCAEEIDVVWSSMARLSLQAAPQDTTSLSLAAHEQALAEVRRNTGAATPASASAALGVLGRSDLSRRLRSSA